MKKVLSIGLLSVGAFLILCSQARSAESSIRARVALALAHSNSSSSANASKITTIKNKADCFCGPNCPCGPDCPCPATGGFKDPACKIPMARSSVGCSCGASCTCIGGECGDPRCPNIDPFSARNAVKRNRGPGPIEWVIYEAQYNKAIKQNKPLLVWVGETCPSCESTWSQYIHARLSEYDGPKGVETGPEVMICKPDGLGGMNILARLDGIPSKPVVEALLNPSQTQSTSTGSNTLSTTIPQQLVFRPMSMPMMSMPMMGMGGFGMGGFGGGFGGGMVGGCGGGG